MTGILQAVLGSTGKVLTTQTFNSSGTWTAPSSVSVVQTLTGRGGSSVADYPSSGSFASYSVSKFGSTGPATSAFDWTTLNGFANGAVSTLGIVGYGPSNFLYRYWLYYYSNSGTLGIVGNSEVANYSGVYFLGSASKNAFNGPGTSGTIDTTGWSAGTGKGYTVDAAYQAAGGAGSASSALGQTFSGAPYANNYPNSGSNAASVSTFTNVSVTPGQTYAITVGSGGYVTLSYLV